MKKYTLLLLLSASALLIDAAEPLFQAGGVALNGRGAIELGGDMAGNVTFYNGKWDFASDQSQDRFRPEVKRTDGTLSVAGEWLLDAPQPVRLEIDARNDRGACRLRYRFASPAPIGCNSLSLQLTLPAARMAGRTILLDDQSAPLPRDIAPGALLARYPEIYKIAIPLDKGKLYLEPRGPVSVEVLDFRSFSQQVFAVRINFRPSSGQITLAELELALRLEPYPMTPLAIAGAANSRFDDSHAADRKGGWTDQGPENDLRSFRAEAISAAPVRFETLERKSGANCIVLGGGGIQWQPRRCTVPVPAGSFRALYLLHAIAWAQPGEIGRIIVHYTDGETVGIPVENERDVANWWLPTHYPNAAPAWTGFNGMSRVGLYAAKFPLAGKPVRMVEFVSNGKSVWMIAAATVSPDAVDLPPPEAGFTVLADAQWMAVENKREIEPGSALDFSFLLEAPAGRFGAVRAAGDHFEFAGRPGKAVRFYGVNLCYSANFPTHREADILAERLSRIGYNAVRFHHFDELLAADDGGVDRERLDRFFYFFAALKKRGIYSTYDLYTNRLPKPGRIAGRETPWQLDDYKLAAMLQPEVLDDLEKFTADWLSAKNPYTGKTLAEDEAVCAISLINESTIFHNIKRASAEMRRCYEEAFQRHSAANGDTVNAQNREAKFNLFLYDVYRRYHRRLADFVRQSGYRGPMTDQNYIISPTLTEIRAKHYDYVDVHQYWDHPVFPKTEWQFPVQNGQQSVIAAGLVAPLGIAAARVTGKPFTVTEFDFCYPNRFRAEGAPIFAAYAGFQNWSGLYRFEYGMSPDEMFRENRIEIFSVVNDPARLLSERLGLVFFVRGDVTAAKEEAVVPVRVRHEDYRNSFPEALNRVALEKRLSIRPSAGDSVEDFLTRTATERKPRVETSTKELAVDFGSRTFRVATAGSEALVLPPRTGGKAKRLNVKNGERFGVFGLIALDGGALASSSRMLVLHLTNVMQENEKFSDRAMSLWEKKAESSRLLWERGAAEIGIAVKEPAKWRIYALDLSGKRTHEIAVRRTPDRLAWQAEAVPAYELIQK